MKEINLVISWILMQYRKLKLNVLKFLYLTLRKNIEKFNIGKISEANLTGVFIGEYLILGVEQDRDNKNMYHILYCKPNDYVSMTTATTDDIMLGNIKFPVPSHKKSGEPTWNHQTTIQLAVNENNNHKIGTLKIGTLTLENDITE